MAPRSSSKYAHGARRTLTRAITMRAPLRGFSSRKKYRLPQNVTGGLYKFTEKATIGLNPGAGGAAINVAGFTSSGGILTFKMGDLANHASYAGLFDLYKIDRVDLQIIPQANVAQTYLVGSASGAGSSIPQLFIAPNRDHWVPAPTSSFDVLNDDGSMVFMMDKPKTLSLYQPRVDASGFDGKLLNIPILANSVQSWLSTGGNDQTVDQSNLLHYGFRWWVDNTQNGGPFIPTIIVTYHLTFKERD